MKRFKEIFLNVEPKPVDEYLLVMIKTYPSLVPIETIIAMYKWTLLNSEFQEERKLFRNILVNIASEQIMKNL